MFTTEANSSSINIILSTSDSLENATSGLSDCAQAWLKTHDFKSKSGEVAILPNQAGAVEAVVLGVEDPADPWLGGKLSGMLPAGHYKLTGSHDVEFEQMFALAWGLGCYRFDRYKKLPAPKACLVIPSSVDEGLLTGLRDATNLVRDLISTPAEDMTPEVLAAAIRAQADELGGQYTEIVGDDLLTENYPMVHAVGRAAKCPPRLTEIRWGDSKHPKLHLVGKGVCFDTGGLDLKPPAGMRHMSKDMGGAAHTLALARLVMQMKLPVCLRVLIPCVENGIGADAYRPGDVLQTRKGITVEVGNTDAEGRLILGDALYEASTDEPDLLIDFATLTGACRIAMGPDLPAMFSPSEEISHGVFVEGNRQYDPVWRMPLHKPYRTFLNSQLADIHNIQNEPGGYGSGITAALFLQEFVGKQENWLHFDVGAMNTRNLPGRPRGGEAFGLRAVFAYLCQRYT